MAVGRQNLKLKESIRMATYKDRIRVHIAGKEFNVVGGEFQDMLAAVKQITGRRFVGELKVWQLPGTVAEVENQLAINGYSLEGGTPVSGASSSGQPALAQAGGDRIRIMVQGQQLAVVGGTFQEMLAVVKGLPGRQYDGQAKLWQIPGELGVIQGMIQAAGFTLEGAKNLPAGPVSPMEPLGFSGVSEPPPFEEPDFSIDDSAFPYEPPDWFDDEHLPPPPEPGDWENDVPSPPAPDTFFDDNDNLPPSFETTTTDSMTARPSGDRIRIRVGVFPFVVTGGAFQDMLAAIKNIPGRRFNGQDKVWEIPDEVGTEKVKQLLAAAGFAVERG